MNDVKEIEKALAKWDRSNSPNVYRPDVKPLAGAARAYVELVESGFPPEAVEAAWMEAKISYTASGEFDNQLIRDALAAAWRALTGEAAYIADMTNAPPVRRDA